MPLIKMPKSKRLGSRGNCKKCSKSRLRTKIATKTQRIASKRQWSRGLRPSHSINLPLSSRTKIWIHRLKVMVAVTSFYVTRKISGSKTSTWYSWSGWRKNKMVRYWLSFSMLATSWRGRSCERRKRKRHWSRGHSKNKKIKLRRKQESSVSKS